MSQTQIPEDLAESYRRAEACWDFTCAVASLANRLHLGSQDGSLIDLEAQIVTRLYQDVRKDKRTFASAEAAEDIIRASITPATGEPRATWHEHAWAVAGEVVAMLMSAGVWKGKGVPREKVTDPELEDWSPRETKLGEHAERLRGILSKYRENLRAGIRQEAIRAADIRRELTETSPDLRPRIDQICDQVKVGNGSASLTVETRVTPATVPLTDQQQAVLNLIRSAGPIIGKTICNQLGIEQSNLTKRVIPALEPHGVKNRRGAGYYVE